MVQNELYLSGEMIMKEFLMAAEYAKCFSFYIAVSWFCAGYTQMLLVLLWSCLVSCLSGKSFLFLPVIILLPGLVVLYHHKTSCMHLFWFDSLLCHKIPQIICNVTLLIFHLWMVNLHICIWQLNMWMLSGMMIFFLSSFRMLHQEMATISVR